MDQTNELILHNINKWYPSPNAKNAKHALVNFTYSFHEGIYLLTGHNGAGKSTLLHILTGYLRADSGDISWNGSIINTRSKYYKSLLGYMPQQQTLYEDMTVVQFMNYLAVLKGLSHRECSEQIPFVLDKVGLLIESNSKLGALSGGMKQRLLFAQSLVGSPKVLLLDEPTAGVDPTEREKMLAIIANNSLDKIVIMSTHIDSDKAPFHAKEIKLEHGNIIQ